MNRLATNLKELWADPHMRVVVIAIAALLLGCEVGQVWLPEHADKFNHTGQIVVRISLLLSLVVGAGSVPQKPDQKP